ncbi:DUF7115 domain-containing protein [Halobacterium noricense]|uniref:DUF7115 domain-containing protein n=1 Tax=Halobacterium noricense TaxID=223182 RepID=UPI001E651D5B|nr:hypothetical protein [Halobacterium noricense]UHH24617.1 hypothetical protein LT974_11560 [Halobacterium noricense]
MNVPALVQSSLGDEDVAAHVPLKGEDAVFVTPTRTLVYTADGLLSDESVDEFPHDAEGIEVSEGRRKAKVTLDYGLDGEESFSVPSGKLDDVLHPIIAGVLNAADVTQPGETVKRTYRFSELTLVATSDRVVKHVGAAVWGPDYEQIGYDSVTGIDAEEGNVSSQLVLETTARTQRIKAPNEQFRDVRETVEEAVYAFHDAANAAEFERMNVDEDAGAATEEVSFDSGVEPIDTSGVGEDDEAAADEAEPSAEASAAGAGAEAGDAASATGEPAERADVNDDEFASSGFQTAASKVEPPVDPEELNAELDDLEDTVEELADALAEQRELAERQREALDAQQTVIEAQRDRLAALRDLVDEE